MSNVIVPAVATAGVIGLGYLAIKKFGPGLRLQLAAQQGPQAVAELEAKVRAAGGSGPSLELAAYDAATNDDSRAGAERTFKSARDYMAAWKAGGASVPRSLTVVKPKDKPSQWSIPEGCWFPGEPGTESFRQEPTSDVRGISIGYALTYWPDVYGASANAGGIAVGYVGPKIQVLYGLKDAYIDARNADSVRLVDLFISSSAQGSQLYAWDPQARKWLSGSEFNIAVRSGHPIQSNLNQYEHLTAVGLERLRKSTFPLW